MKEIKLFKAHVDMKEASRRIQEVLESGFINEGMQVTELTEKMKDFLRTENLILVNSCTSAITIALKLAGVSFGDDVVSTSMTCVATNMPIKNVGANIVWADVDENTGMLSPESIESAITEKTKAVILVLWAGNPSRLIEIYDLCKKKNVKLIIDAAHAFLAKYDKKQVHNFADYTCYSFQAIKHITTGDGGALVCSDKNDYLTSKKIKWFGLDRDKSKDEKGDWKGQQWDVDIDCVGYKFNMNNISAALGLSQVKYIEKIVSSHKYHQSLYDKLFESTELVKPLKKDEKADGSSWVYTVVLCDELAEFRDSIVKQLNEDGIKAGIVHVPNHDYTVFKEEYKDLPGVRKFFSKQFSIPCGWWMKKNDVGHVFDRLLIHVENAMRNKK